MEDGHGGNWNKGTEPLEDHRLGHRGGPAAGAARRDAVHQRSGLGRDRFYRDGLHLRKPRPCAGVHDQPVGQPRLSNRQRHRDPRRLPADLGEPGGRDDRIGEQSLQFAVRRRAGHRPLRLDRRALPPNGHGSRDGSGRRNPDRNCGRRHRGGPARSLLQLRPGEPLAARCLAVPQVRGRRRPSPDSGRGKKEGPGDRSRGPSTPLADRRNQTSLSA
jgi:hypothetical protein